MVASLRLLCRRLWADVGAAAYAIAVRASEYGEDDAMLEEIVARTVLGVKNRDDSEGRGE